jgi:hypothetical protein
MDFRQYSWLFRINSITAPKLLLCSSRLAPEPKDQSQVPGQTAAAQYNLTADKDHSTPAPSINRQAPQPPVMLLLFGN